MRFSYEDLQPYTPTPEQDAKYIKGLAQYQPRPLDERFADFKVRLASALKNRGIS